jgi:hypothetical protein
MNGKINHLSQIAYARRYTLTEGAEAGIKVIEVFNGRLRFLINESKCLDVMQLFDGDVNISFLSKNGFHFADLAYERRFEGGMLYTCGLDNAGTREGYPVHGTIHTIPARVTSILCNEDEIKVVGEMRSSALFGNNLLLTRTISTKIGGDTFTIEDVLQNQGHEDSEYCLLYHVNVGYPMLDEGVKILQDELSCEPRNEWAKAKFDTRNILTDAVVGEEEQCYYTIHNTPHVEVVNNKLGRTFTLDYTKDTLPCFVQWNSRMSGDYAQGLEPSTTFLDDTFARTKIRAGETVRFGITMGVKRH